MVSFTVYGVPAPKGSAKAFYRPGMRHPVVTHDSARTKPWEALVKAAAVDVAPPCLYDGPVVLSVVFSFARPKSLPKRIRACTKRPDLDKLVRVIADALTGLIWHDDAQLVRIEATKEYAGPQGRPGAKVTVVALRESPARSGAPLPSPLDWGASYES